MKQRDVDKWKGDRKREEKYLEYKSNSNMYGL